VSNQNYRCYCLDQQGHVGLAEWIEADTDDEAILESSRNAAAHAHVRSVEREAPGREDQSRRSLGADLASMDPL
jgi:hypothetical protein